MESGTSKRSTMLVNDTLYDLHLYYGTSSINAIFRKTLHPKLLVDNDARVYVNTDTGVTTVQDVNTYIEEFDSNNTCAMLSLRDENHAVVSFDADQLNNNSVIKISLSPDGSFTHTFTPRNMNDHEMSASDDYLRLSSEAIQATQCYLPASNANSSQRYGNGSNIHARSGISITKFSRRQCEVLMEHLLRIPCMLYEGGNNSLVKDSRVWPTQLSKELSLALKDAQTLIGDCCKETSCLRAALRHSQRSQSFADISQEILWYIEVMYFYNINININITQHMEQAQPSNINPKEFPRAKLDFKDQFFLKEAVEKDLKLMKSRLKKWNKDHCCSAEICGNSKRDIRFCVASQILRRWNKSGRRCAPPPPSSNGEHKSLLCIFDKEVLHDGPVLGSGSFAFVQEVTWLGEKFARKVFKKSGLDSLPAEATALAKLNHPHIVKVFAYSEDSILLDRMSGDLREFIDLRMKEEAGGVRHSQPFSLPAAVDLMLQIADAMSYLHSQKIAHRDLKSGNILINPVDTPSLSDEGFVFAKIADFGLAKTKREITAFSHLTANTGTKLWMAPELHGAHAHENHLREAFPMKVDVYSFGIICSEILTGELPFRDVKFSELYKKLTATVPLRPNLPPSCPKNLASLIRSCWVTDPPSRPAFPKVSRKLRFLKGLLMTGLRVEDVELPSGTTQEVDNSLF